MEFLAALSREATITPSELQDAKAWWDRHSKQMTIQEMRKKQWPHLFK
jgi:hypothetical protein